MSLILGDSLLRNDKSLETTLNNKIDKLDTSDQSLSSSLLIPNGKSITSYDNNSNLSKLIWINQNKLELGTNNIDTNIYSLNRPKIYTNNNSSIIENEVAYKSEIDNLPNQLKSTFLPLSGGVMTGAIQCNSDMKLSSNNGVIRFGNQTDVGHIMVAANNNTFKFLRPGTNSDMDLGNSSNKWKDLYLSGTVNADDVSVNTINANTINQNNKQVANQEDLSNEITNRQTAITNVQNQINTITNAIIRRDVAQTLTDTEKQRAQTNITHTATQNHATSGVQVGWYQVANLKTNGNYNVKIKQAYNYNFPEAIQLAISINHRFFTNEPFASITQLSGVNPAAFSLSKIRVRQGTDSDTTYLDVYNPDQLWNTTWVDITSDSWDVVVEPNSPFQFIGTEDNPSGYKISSLDLITGFNTSYLRANTATISGTVSNLNTISQPVNSVVTYSFGASCANAPITDSGMVTQMQESTAYCTQLVIANDENASTWRRSYRDGTWTEWIEVGTFLRYEYNKALSFGNTGALYIGKFPIYDTNITVDISCTTSTTYSGKLIIACQNHTIMKASVFGDYSNILASSIYYKPVDNTVEIYFTPQAWSKNVIHITGCGIQGEVTHVCENISAIPTDATSHPENEYDTYTISTAKWYTRNALQKIFGKFGPRGFLHTLYGGAAGSGNITLSDSYKNYDMLIIMCSADNRSNIGSYILPTWLLDRLIWERQQTGHDGIGIAIGQNYWYIKKSSTVTSFVVHSENATIEKIYGIKFSELWG